MCVGVPGFKQGVPLLHRAFIQTDCSEHGDPLIYADLFFHILSFISVLFSTRVMAVTRERLKCEVLVGSTPRSDFFFTLLEEKRTPGGFETRRGFIVLPNPLPAKPTVLLNVNIDASSV